MSRRLRLDVLLVQRGLAESREKARALVMAGRAAVNGQVVHKAGALVDDTAPIDVSGPEHPWASRGGIKLAHALDTFDVDVTGQLALDIGASTGGFTDVLLQRGARAVIALDVGHGQLHWKLRTDPRVTVIEGLNARHLSRADLPDLGEGVQVATIDVSFISLVHILPVLPPLLAPGAAVIALVKPQFEAGREEVGRKGIVTDPGIHARVLDKVIAAAAEVGLTAIDTVPSPITGAEGNREFLVRFAGREPQSIGSRD